MLTLPPLRELSKEETACNTTMDPLATTPQNDDIDPLELEDRQLPDEETAELAHIEDPEAPEAIATIADEERDLHKVLDTVTKGVEVPDEEAPDEVVSDPKSTPGAAATLTDKKDVTVVKKSGSHIIPKDLIDRELTTEDLLDDGAL